MPEAAPTKASSARFVDVEVCIVDASLQAGLRTLRAKRDRRTGEIYVMAGGRRQPLERVYPAVGASGYADGVPWFESEAPIRLYGGRYHRYGPERVVPAGQLRRGEAHDGILVFLDPQDTSPPAPGASSSRTCGRSTSGTGRAVGFGPAPRAGAG